MGDTVGHIFSETRQELGAIVAQEDRAALDAILGKARARVARLLAEAGTTWGEMDLEALGDFGVDLDALADGWDFDPADWEIDPAVFGYVGAWDKFGITAAGPHCCVVNAWVKSWER